MLPFLTLIKKEIFRFSSIWLQTMIGPLTTAILYQLIFGQQLSGISTGVAHVSYAGFLIPGLVMMQILLNAFGNGSSSLIQSKYTGNIIFVLMAPISPFAMYSAYLISSIVRGLMVGAVVFCGIIWFGELHISHVWAIIFFAVFGAAIMAGLGIIGGILFDKFDQLAGIQSFIIIPMIYLSGIFFNVKNFAEPWKLIAMFNPFLHIVDGFRYGFIGHSSFNIGFGVGLVFVFALLINIIGVLLLTRGIKIKN